MRVLSVVVLLASAGCMGMPEKVTPVQGFDVNRYLGTWYEIARLDHPFEKGLSRVTAHYSLSNDGKIIVENRGYSQSEKKWKTIKGRAMFVNSPQVGYLKVSFWGPFFSSYVIFEIEQQEYQYAFVSGYNTNYLWLLSRTPSVDDSLRAAFVKAAELKGFETEKLFFVRHD